MYTFKYISRKIINVYFIKNTILMIKKKKLQKSSIDTKISQEKKESRARQLSTALYFNDIWLSVNNISTRY